MAKMTRAQAERFLTGSSHKGTLILSVPRPDRGPLSVPLAFRYVDGGFEFSTKPTRLHARAFMEAGRATVMVHYEDYGPGGTLEQYVMAEGPVRFLDAAAKGDTFFTARLEPDSFIAVEYS